MAAAGTTVGRGGEPVERLRPRPGTDSRLRALRALVHSNSGAGHPRPGRSDLCQRSILARAAHHHQSAFRAWRIDRQTGQRTARCTRTRRRSSGSTASRCRFIGIRRRRSPRRLRGRASSSRPAPARASRCASSSRSSTRRSGPAPPAKPPRTRAIVVYPMNALANSQLKELDKFIDQSGLPDRLRPTFARYTGPGKPGGARAHPRGQARHPAHQLHDARAADDAAERRSTAR